MIDAETLKKACDSLRREADEREATGKDLSRSGMTESGAVQRNRAGGLREALAILEAFFGKEVTGA